MQGVMQWVLMRGCDAMGAYAGGDAMGAYTGGSDAMGAYTGGSDAMGARRCNYKYGQGVACEQDGRRRERECPVCTPQVLPFHHFLTFCFTIYGKKILTKVRINNKIDHKYCIS